MSIITISRGSCSHGKEVAEKAALQLGYECISRDILLKASEEFNIPENKLIRALHDSSSVLERFTHEKKRYVSYIRKALLQHVQQDNVVYHGLAGHWFLMNIPHVLKVRIIVDMEERVKEEVKRKNISEEKALSILKSDDAERRKWSREIYGIDTWDSRLYDIVLHIKTLTIDDAVNIICQTVKKPFFKTTPESQKILNDSFLAAKVHAALMGMGPTVKVSSDDGVVTIGDTESLMNVKDNVFNEIKHIAEKIEGVKEVVFDIHETAGRSHAVNPFHNI